MTQASENVQLALNPLTQGHPLHPSGWSLEEKQYVAEMRGDYAKPKAPASSAIAPAVAPAIAPATAFSQCIQRFQYSVSRAHPSVHWTKISFNCKELKLTQAENQRVVEAILAAGYPDAIFQRPGFRTM